MMETRKLLLLLAMLVFISACKKTPADDVAVERMRCELRTNPMGIDAQNPRLSWNIISDTRGQKQTAYRILVASSIEKLDCDIGDIWDSGKVNSGRSDNIEYEGKALTSDNKYFWKVRIWDKNERPAEWSASAFWTTGLFEGAEWKAKWIGFDRAVDTDDIEAEHRILSARMLRNEFGIDKEVSKATAFVCGLGLFEFYLNGQKIGDQVLAPALSEYDKRLY
jgi:alpha-L-rhamnosidase